MPDEEFKVEVELGNHEHHLSIWQRLRTLDVDDEARQRLGGRVTVTRDGNRLELYTHTLQDAREVERAVHELVQATYSVASYTTTRWDAEPQQWVDPSDGDAGPDVGPHAPLP